MPIITWMGEFAAELPKARTPAFRLRSLGDDRLGRLVAAGDERAFAIVYERYYQPLYRYCRSIVGDPDDAADALQNTMAAALRGLTGETREIKLKPWLFRIAHNECISLLRGRRPQVAIDESLELIAPAGTDAMTRERLRQLVADLQQLPDAQRSALVMRELSGLGYEEIATALGGNVASARQAVFEARSALHELAEGRAMDCDGVRRALSDNDGRVLRGRKLRSHLRACSSCRDFRDLIGTRKRDLALVAPPIPAALAAGLLHHIVGGGAATATSGAGAGGAGLGSLAAGKAVAASTAFKAAAIVACTAAVGAGTVETVHQVEKHSSAPAAAPAKAAPVQSSVSAHTSTLNLGTPTPGAGVTHRNTNSSAPAKSHHKNASTHTGLGHSLSPGKSGEHKQTGKPAHPEHPTTPTGKDDTPGQGKGNSNGSGNAKAPAIKGPPVTKPTPQKPVTTLAPVTPTLPDQAQNGIDRSGVTHRPPDIAKGVGQGLSRH
jgi:RNA polymerase sigma factor (sigma-70 family)